MGAIHFSLSPHLVSALQSVLPMDVLVETGTFEGDTVATLLTAFAEIHSVELSEVHFQRAVRRFSGESHVQVVHGDSQEYLRLLRPRLAGRGVLYFLDAHWCVASNTAGETSQCPLLQEISAIDRLNANSVIVIDDARLFQAPPPAPHEIADWPALQQILDAFREVGPVHELMVVNDMIVFHPPSARPALVGYATTHGVDWLQLVQQARAHAALLSIGQEKETVIQAQHHAILDLQEKEILMAQQLVEKEVVLLATIGSATEMREREDKLAQVIENQSERIEKIIADVTHLSTNVTAALRRNEVAPMANLVNAQSGEIALLSAQLATLNETAINMARGVTRRVDSEVEEQKRIEVASGIASALTAATEQYLSHEVNAALIKGLNDKETVIQEMKAALQAYQSAAGIFGSLAVPLFRLRPKRVLAQVLPRLRLGVLYQHEPRALHLPQPTKAPVKEGSLPTISIVTPSYKQAKFIERTLDSVFGQHYPNLEYYVQDGGSDDGTVEILKQYEDKLSGWTSINDGGQSQAINLGFAKTSGEIMGWLNSDDILTPGALKTIGGFFRDNPTVDVVYGHRLLIDEADRQIGRWVLPSHDGNVLSWADYIPQETLYWRRSIWEKAGGRIDESFRFAMDWDLLLRFRDAGARFRRLDRVLGCFRIHEHQKTSAAMNEIGFAEMSHLRNRVLGRVPTHNEIRKAILPYLLKHLAADLRWQTFGRL